MGTTNSAGGSGDSSHDLAEHGGHRNSQRQRDSVSPIGTQNMIGRLGGRGQPDGDRLLPLAGVGRAMHQALSEEIPDAILHIPDLDHALPPGEERVTEFVPPSHSWTGGRGHGASASSSAHHGAGASPDSSNVDTCSVTYSTEGT